MVAMDHGDGRGYRRVGHRRQAGTGRCASDAAIGLVAGARVKQHVQPQTVAWAGGAMRFDADRIRSPSAALFDPASSALAATVVTRAGRQAAWFVQGEFGSGVLRHYRRGGLIARLSADRYIWTGSAATRSFAEY